MRRAIVVISGGCYTDLVFDPPLADPIVVDVLDYDNFQDGDTDAEQAAYFHELEQAVDRLNSDEQQNPERTVWTCPRCKSCRVQSQSWVRLNTGAVLDDTGGYHWCDACEADSGDGELPCNGGLVELPYSQCREAIEAATTA